MKREVIRVGPLSARIFIYVPAWHFDIEIDCIAAVL